MNQRRYLVTGATGFVGWHMLNYLCKHLSDTDEIHAVYRYRSKCVPSKALQHFIDYPTIRSRVVWHQCDLIDYIGTIQMFKQIRPTHISHLAAMSFVPQSFTSPTSTLSQNIAMQTNVLEAACEVWDASEDPEYAPRVHCCGSSEEYGLVNPDEVPLTERSPLRPLSPYGVSKIAQDFLGYQYHQTHGLWTVRTRAHNHSGPGRGTKFVASAFSIRAIDAYERFLDQDTTHYHEVISTGNTDAIRDFTDVRDTVRAYVMLLESESDKCCGEVYNIATGVGQRMRDVLHTICLIVSGEIENHRAYSEEASWYTTKVDPRYERPSDVPLLIGDYTRIKEAVGWEPTIPWLTTISDVVKYWQLKKKGL